MHLDKEEIEAKKAWKVNPKNIIPVYYDIELSNDGEMEQIGACTFEGYMFSGIIRTSVRTNRSSLLRAFLPEIWNMPASDAKSVLQSFVY